MFKESAGLTEGWGATETVPVGPLTAVEGEVEVVFWLFLRARIPPVMPKPKRAPRMTAKRSSLNMV